MHTLYTPFLLLAVSCIDNKENEEPEPIVTAELYDFDAAAPWYQGAGVEFPPEATIVTGFDQADQY